MTDAKSALLAVLKRATHASSPSWNSVHQCWTLDVSFPPGNAAFEFRRLVEQYRQERVG